MNLEKQACGATMKEAQKPEAYKEESLQMWKGGNNMSGQME